MFKLLSTICFCSIVIAKAPPSFRQHHVASRRQQRDDHGGDQDEGELSFVVQLFIISVIQHEDTVTRVGMGSMITPQWVLTAAHNIENVPGDETIFVWYKNFTDSPLISKYYSKVMNINRHPAFKMSEAFGMATNDICLLLVTTVTLQKYGRVLPVDYMSMMGLPATYVGRGQAPDPEGDLYAPLQVWEASVVPCDDILKKARNYQICISPKCSQRLNMPLIGDSGGPLLHDAKIIGVLTSGRINGNKITGEFKGIYPMAFTGFTATSPYMDWISGVLRSRAVPPAHTDES